jgi:hypothetical protein
MRKIVNPCGLTLTLLLGSAAATVRADTAPPDNTDADSATVWNAFLHGKAQLRLRLRHEHFEAEEFTKDADATTLLTRVDYHTRPWQHLQLFVQLDDIRHLGAEDFNDTRNGRTTYPLVPDPDGLTLNGLHLDWTGLPHTTLALGRQCIDYDYVGCAGLAWRQNDPVYDAARLVNTSLQDVTLSAAYITRLHTPFGPQEGTPPKSLAMDTATLIAEYKGWADNRLGLHLYHVDSEDLPSASTDSIGLRLDGMQTSGDWQWLYGARWFTQADTGPNPEDYRADNYFLEGGVGYKGWTAKLSRDVLEGDATRPGRHYTRPLNVVHFYLGWAEKFAPLPATGVEDTFLTVSGPLPLEMRASLVFHYFDSEATSRHYGQEWDFVLTKNFGKHVQGLLKLADYQAGDAGPGPAGLDATKIWAQLLLTY